MALDRSPESKLSLFKLCVVEIQSESAWVLKNIIPWGNTCHAKFHASEASGSEEEDFNIFCVFLGSNPEHLFLALAAILFIRAEPF